MSHIVAVAGADLKDLETESSETVSVLSRGLSFWARRILWLFAYLIIANPLCLGSTAPARSLVCFTI